MADWHSQIGIIELSLFEGIVLLIAGYQLWSVRRSLKAMRQKKQEESQDVQRDQDS